MNKYETALKNDDEGNFLDSTTDEYQSSAKGQAIRKAIQQGTMDLTAYSITASSRRSDTEYRFNVKEKYVTGGVTHYEYKTYSVIKSGTRWLVDDQI